MLCGERVAGVCMCMREGVVGVRGLCCKTVPRLLYSQLATVRRDGAGG